MEIPDGYTIENPSAAATHAQLARPPVDVLAELADLCADADTLVAYNGTGLDFGELDAACEAAGLRPLDGPARVDALYLAYAWWPAEAGHRLRPLAEAVGVDVSDLRWHDAADDAEALARLVVHGAETVCGAFSEPWPAWSPPSGSSSPAWRLAFDLAVPARSGRTPDIVQRDESDISAMIDTRTGRAGAACARRCAPGGGDGPVLLAGTGRGGRPVPAVAGHKPRQPAASRPSSRWPPRSAVPSRPRAGPGRRGPTGTGKSLAALARRSTGWPGTRTGGR